MRWARRACLALAALSLAAAGCTSSQPQSKSQPQSTSQPQPQSPPGSPAPAAGAATTTTTANGPNRPAAPPVPTLGSAAALTLYVSGAGFGEVRPPTVSLGGDATGRVYDITWQSWGGAQAVGTGTGWLVPAGEIVGHGTAEPARIVAFDLGTCEGLYMYRSVGWYFPQAGQTFEPPHGMDACDPAAPGLEHPTSGVGFLSPSRNISCQMLDGPPYPGHLVHCQSSSPPASATLEATGSYSTCSGIACLGNAAAGTPVLAYGHSLVLGPFRCASGQDGVACTVGGRGFRISSGGVVPAPANP